MNIIARNHRPTRWPGRKAIAAGLGIALLVLAGTVACPAAASAAESTKSASPIDQAADSLRSGYRQQQWERLSRNNDRDSLIAAVLLGMPTDSDPAPVEGHDLVEQRLATRYGRDPFAMYALALACEVQKGTCTHPEYFNHLVRIAPDNAIHWLLLPNQAAPDADQLHSAATASMADSHLTAIIGLLRKALADQPAPPAATSIGPHELALLLRRNAVDAVPLPYMGAVVGMCKPPAGANSADCIQLGRRLFADRSGAILSRMIGVAIMRRLEKGSSDDARGKQARRDYVWMSEQMDNSNRWDPEQKQADLARFDEWTAWQRAVRRLGVSSTPPAGWVPKHPEYLLLSEERTPPAPTPTPTK